MQIRKTITGFRWCGFGPWKIPVIRIRPVHVELLLAELQGCVIYVYSHSFLRIRIQLFFSMRIRIQLNKFDKKLPYEELKKIAKKLNHGADPNLQKNLNKEAINTNFLAFFQIFPSNFSFLDPDPGGKMNTYRSMRIRIPGSMKY